ncbi:hypothetical protein RB620_22885 [Paenibacillus sp. LHD-117]|uniref:hypothetical protein n=1 Tax=Paenibacillus sp. LHD-117 TaxID=3071412 RepID=UPI0027E1C7F4|nr:hypothetical protein [Paenibacillus sp. LHD-117]MDQ6422278.1 hypothetical protein [Paenibacillus sp. LHD-117]
MKRRIRLARYDDDILIVVVPAWKWKEFIVFELLGGTAFYLIGKVLVQTEWFCIAANMAGPQMLKYTNSVFRSPS